MGSFAILRLPLLTPTKPPPLLSSSPSYLAGAVARPLQLPPDRRRPPLAAVVARSGYNVQIVVDEAEPEEALLRRFRREVSKAGVIQECKRRRFFENKHDEKKRKAREAGRRNRRRRLGPRFNSSYSSREDAAAPKKADDVDDNWDLPEGDLPY